jgi:general secretion pathway protein M
MSMDAVTAWFKTLEHRERILVSAAGAMLAIALIYFAILAPFHRAVDTRIARVDRKQQDLAWLRSVSPSLRAMVMSQPGVSGESLVVLLDRTARQSGIANAVTAQTPNGEHGMRVRLESASFDSMIVWLAGLQQQQGVNVESANIDRTEKAGIVNASLVLTRGGPEK